MIQDSIVDELENLPGWWRRIIRLEWSARCAEGYYKSKPRQHNSLSQQKEFRAIKNAIIQEAERLCPSTRRIFCADCKSDAW